MYAAGFAPKHDETIKWAQGKLIEMSEQTARAALDLSKELRKAWGPHAEASADEAQAQALLDGVPDLKKWISQQVRKPNQFKRRDMHLPLGMQ